MFVNIINDCADDNARARQESKISSLTGLPTSYIGVKSDLEAGVHLLDILDSTGGRPGLILVNVAPRGRHTVQWENGTPFSYTKYKDTVIVSTVDGFCLSGLKQFTDLDSVSLLDIHAATAAMAEAGFIDNETAATIPHTQFRSLNFSPVVGAFLLQDNGLPATEYSLDQVPDLPPAIWHIDSFGNCKTTLTEADVDGKDMLDTRFGHLPIVQKLRDVADGTSAAILGSSGLAGHKFVELVIQNISFANRHDANVGDDIFSETSHLVTATSV